MIIQSPERALHQVPPPLRAFLYRSAAALTFSYTGCLKKQDFIKFLTSHLLNQASADQKNGAMRIIAKSMMVRSLKSGDNCGFCDNSCKGQTLRYHRKHSLQPISRIDR